MPIRVQCSGCKTALAVKDHLAGKRVRCPKCQNPIAVPAQGVTAPPGAKPAPKAAAPMPVAKPKPAPKTPVGPPRDLEAEAAAALRDEPPPTPPANGHGANGNGATVKPPIKFVCDYCEAAIEFEADLAGKRAQCPECRQIVKVPVPKEEKPKDWRTVEKKGPSAAAANQPGKIEDAWGTEKKSTVSQKALLEAGVISKPKAPSIGVGGWIARGVKTLLVVGIVGGLGLFLWNLRHSAIVKDQIGQMEKVCKDTWPPVIQGHFYVGLGEFALRQPKQGEIARSHFMTAWQKVPTSSDPSDKLDRDAFLIQLALAQVNLGGSEYDIRGKDRFDWNQEVFEAIDRTVKKIDSPEARAAAVRELAFALHEKQQPKIAMSLVRSVGINSPPARAVEIAILWADPSKQDEAKKLAPFPEPGKKSADIVARCGYAEGLARLDKIDEALKIAELPGETPHKFQALMAVASALSLDPKADKAAGVKQACDKATALLERDPKANISSWLLVQHVRYSARSGSEGAKDLSQKVPTACKRRAQLEIALAALDKAPPQPEAITIIDELDKEGPGRGLAWLTLAQARARTNQSFTFAPDDPDDEKYEPFFRSSEIVRTAAK